MTTEKKKVLLVEDDELISETVIKSLKLEGYEVDIARDGKECIDKVKESPPDLILLDVLLPQVSGWETLSRIRDHPIGKDIPIIILTALADEVSKIQGLRGGADDYVTKPFSSLELMARVEAVIKRSSRRASSREARGINPIPARKGEKIVLIDPDTIVFINIQRDSTYIHTDEGKFLSDHTLGELEKVLDREKFFRAHRSYIVNLRRVKEITKHGASAYELTMNDKINSKVPMSRRQSAELKKLLNI